MSMQDENREDAQRWTDYISGILFTSLGVDIVTGGAQRAITKLVGWGALLAGGGYARERVCPQ
jgi:hypothetical protein